MKTAVIYWSGTGNTEAMANAVAEGAGADALTVSDFSGNIADFDALAFGCPAMGAEVIEEAEMEPFFSEAEGKISGKKVGRGAVICLAEKCLPINDTVDALPIEYI